MFSCMQCFIRDRVDLGFVLFNSLLALVLAYQVLDIRYISGFALRMTMAVKFSKILTSFLSLALSICYVSGESKFRNYRPRSHRI